MSPKPTTTAVCFHPMRFISVQLWKFKFHIGCTTSANIAFAMLPHSVSRPKKNNSNQQTNMHQCETIQMARYYNCRWSRRKCKWHRNLWTKIKKQPKLKKKKKKKNKRIRNHNVCVQLIFVLAVIANAVRYLVFFVMSAYLFIIIWFVCNCSCS